MTTNIIIIIHSLMLGL